VTFAAIRIAELCRLFTRRYGPQLPDDDAGRCDLEIAAHHLSQLSGDPRKRIMPWIREWAPWATIEEIDALLAAAIVKPKHWKADQLAWRLRLIDQDRTTLEIKTIGAVDMSKSERTKRRKRQAKERKEAERRAQGRKTRNEYLAQFADQPTKPWILLGISRRTWYRRRVAQGLSTA